MFYELLGIDADTIRPVARQNQVLVQMINMMSPQLIHEAKSKGISVPEELEDVVDAAYRHVEEAMEED
jgi:hypothetical protein